MKKLIFVLIIITGPILLFSQKTFYNAMLDARNIWDKDKENYIKPLIHLEHINTDTLSKRERNVYLETLFTISSFACDFEKTLYYELLRKNTYYSSFSNSEEIKDSSFFDCHLVSASNAIDSLARRYEVIMINESHHTPYHRNFVTSLLPDLKRQGFKYLALEALYKDSVINQRGYPCYDNGMYIREPLFGEMLREAIRLGFKLVSYDTGWDCDGKGKDKYFCDRYRDSIAAVNIYKIKKLDKSAKILVYAGYSHIKEKNRPNKPRMAEYFKRISGIDPLTIDQTTMMDFGEEKNLNPYYRFIKDKISEKPMVAFCNENNTFWSENKAYDIMIFSPSPTIKNNRYSFYSINNTRKKYYIDSDIAPEAFFVEAFYEKEKGDNNIPADQTYFQNNKAVLFLKPGKYMLHFYDKKGNLIGKNTKKFK